MSTSAAARLRLAPHAVVLRRDRAHLQVGLEPGVVCALSLGDLLARLRSGITYETWPDHARAAGLSVADADTLLTELGEARLLLTQPRPRATVRLLGAGPLAFRLATTLADDLASLYVADVPGPFPGDAARVVEVLARRRPQLRVRVVTHWSKPEDVALDLTVLVADGPEPDRLVTDHLTATDQPHLVVRSSGAEVSVGPLVRPGQTCCLRCTDLARRDADPQWPWLLPQLVRLRLDPDPVLLAWATGVAAAQVRAHLSGARPESAGATLELSRSDHLMRLRTWPRHGECGCGWRGATE